MLAAFFSLLFRQSVLSGLFHGVNFVLLWRPVLVGRPALLGSWSEGSRDGVRDTEERKKT